MARILSPLPDSQNMKNASGAGQLIRNLLSNVDRIGESALSGIRGILSGGEIIRPKKNRDAIDWSFEVGRQPEPGVVESLLQASPSPTPTPAPQAQSPQDLAIIEQNIRRRLENYGNQTRGEGSTVPLIDYIPQMMEAIEQYDFWRNNPYLLAQIPILETSGGRNVTRPNNIANWGINVPGNNEIFAEMTKPDVFSRFISGMGERSSIYDQFRTGQPLTDEQILELAATYTPDAGYGTNLLQGIRQFEQGL